MRVRVVWDGGKSLSNRRKHGVSFEEVKELFASGDYLEIFDESHSDSEDRFLTIGPVARGLVLVSWTERDDDVIRIISARWASPREMALFQSYMDENR